ncbi:MAG: DUF4397 domain-containing protein [Lachnospiraceae bacterium]|nr:DUF4397 domain-containing protein [Lachnospiraceae bacterium]
MMDNTDPAALPSPEENESLQLSGEETPGRVIINYCLVRVLHAAVKQPPIRVMIGNRMITNHLGYGKISQYERVSCGNAMVTIYGGINPEEKLYQADISFKAGTSITLAVTSTGWKVESGVIYDGDCRYQPQSGSCLRAVNLTGEQKPFDILLSSGRIVFHNVKNREVTAWRQNYPGEYDFYLVPTPEGVYAQEETVSLEEMPYVETEFYRGQEAVLMFYQRLLSDTRYTCFIIGGGQKKIPIQIVFAEN